MAEASLGGFLRRKREEQSLTLRGLAAELDIAPPYLHDIEKDNRTPSDRLLPAFIRFLHLTPGEETELYELVGDRRGQYPDLQGYMNTSPMARAALRTARDRQISDKLWMTIIRTMEEGG